MSPKTRSQSLPTMRANHLPPVRRFSLDANEYRRATKAPVARGGFSDVYKYHSAEHGLVAVKRLRFNENERENLDVLVEQEARVLTMIKHPHILPFLGLCSMEGAVCIVTPWAEKGSMSLFLARNPDADRLGLLTQVASALSYLHENAGDIIIHGDLHVDNVLISHMGTALLADFGLSRIVPEGHSSSLYRGDTSDCRIGRVVYEAPELHDGEPRSWATDVFAFGMLIFHAYSGKQPLASAPNYLTAVVALYRGDRPVRSEITRSDFSDPLWDLVRRCWTARPRERPRMPVVAREMSCLSGQRICPSSCPGRETAQTCLQSAPDAIQSLPQNTLGRPVAYPVGPRDMFPLVQGRYEPGPRPRDGGTGLVPPRWDQTGVSYVQSKAPPAARVCSEPAIDHAPPRPLPMLSVTARVVKGALAFTTYGTNSAGKDVLSSLELGIGDDPNGVKEKYTPRPPGESAKFGTLYESSTAFPKSSAVRRRLAVLSLVLTASAVYGLYAVAQSPSGLAVETQGRELPQGNGTAQPVGALVASRPFDSERDSLDVPVVFMFLSRASSLRAAYVDLVRKVFTESSVHVLTSAP